MSNQLAPDTAPTGVRPLAGKAALVTGGSRGIGAAIVRRLTADGAQVAFTYASAKDQADAVAEATGALAMQADNSDHEAVRAAVSRTTEHFGGLDILVNNVDRAPQPGISVYALAKAAVGGFTRGLARELGPRGITVNTVQPGPTDTDMNPDSGPSAEWMKRLTTAGHYGRPADIASAVAYLASPQARFVTGTNVDGGSAV